VMRAAWYDRQGRAHQSCRWGSMPQSDGIDVIDLHMYTTEALAPLDKFLHVRAQDGSGYPCRCGSRCSCPMACQTELRTGSGKAASRPG
jgi:hypothetical protein